MRQNNMFTIGLTGGVGAGKSRLLAFLHEKYDAFVLQADLIGHLVMEPGQVCYQPVIDLFGEQIIKEDKTLDRKRISDIVFVEAEKREMLNAIIHPAVKSYIREALAEEEKSGRRIAVVEAALLLEDNYQEFCDEVWYVYTEESIRIRRLMDDRGYSEEKCRSIMAAQKPDEFFRAHADFVIDNSGSPEEADRQIDERLAGFCAAGL